MACHDVTVFDTYVRERIARSKTEAARVVLDFVEKDRVKMSEAVLLAIEALPTSKTRELRRIVEQFETYCEWIDVWAARGWHLEAAHDGGLVVTKPGQVFLIPPKEFDDTDIRSDSLWPTAEIVSVALGVERGALKVLGYDYIPKIKNTVRVYQVARSRAR